MQYFEKFLKDIHSLKLETTSKDGQEFLSPKSYFDNYYVKNNMTKALVVSDLLVLSEIQLQYQLNSIALILEKFLIYFDLGGHRKCLNWLVKQKDPFDKDLNTDEMDEEIVDYIEFLKEEDLTTKEAINDEIWMWADECLFIEVESKAIIIDDPSVFFEIIEDKLRHSITMLQGLVSDIETITKKKPILSRTSKEISDQFESLLYREQRTKIAQNTFVHFLKTAQIKTLYEALKGKYIAPNTTLKQFSALFDSNVKQTTPIMWLTFKGDLVFLFESLKNDHKIRVSETSLQAKLQRGFIDVQKETMSNLKQAKQSYLNNKAGEPTNAEELKAIIANLPK